jgi:hypothetical protein
VARYCELWVKVKVAGDEAGPAKSTWPERGAPVVFEVSMMIAIPVPDDPEDGMTDVKSGREATADQPPGSSVVTITTRTSAHGFACQEVSDNRGAGPPEPEPAAWDTVTVAVNEPAVNTTWAERGAATGFAAAVTATDWPVWPVWRSNDNHDASVDADQVPKLVVTTTDCRPPAATGCHDDGDTDSAAPAWVTVKLAVALPALNVNVPCRAEAAVFAVALTATLAPEAPEAGAADSQAASDDTDQEAALVVGTTAIEPPTAGADHADADSDRLSAAADWLTVKVAVDEPALNTTWADRVAATGLAAAVTVTDWPVWPVWRSNDTHDASVDADQVPRFVVTPTDRCPPAATSCQDDGDTDNAAAAAAWVTARVAVAPPAVNVNTP